MIMSDSVPAANPYAPPSSALQEQVKSDFLSIEDALSRGYNFGVDGLINQAWQRVKGSKGVFWAGLLTLAGAALALEYALRLGLTLSGLGDDDALTKVLNNLVSSLLSPLSAGLIMMGVQRAADQSIRFSDLFKHLGKAVPILLTSFFMSAMIALGFLLLVLPGIYLSVAYLLAIPLVIERGLSPWQAMEASRKAISQHWFKVFGWLITLGLIILVSALPLGIGLIWSLPMTFISTGILYRIIFGVLPVTE
jgi:hypothetical protein